MLQAEILVETAWLHRLTIKHETTAFIFCCQFQVAPWELLTFFAFDFISPYSEAMSSAGEAMSAAAADALAVGPHTCCSPRR
jgi:hypothetical protein